MNDALQKGLQQIKNESRTEGYLLAIADARLEVHRLLCEYPEDSLALWGMLGGLSRLEVHRRNGNLA